MNRLKAFLGLCFVLAIVFCGVIFSLNNSLAVQTDLIFWLTPEMPLGVLMTITLLIGCALGGSVNSLWSWRLLGQRKALQKKLDQSQKRFEQLQ